MAETPQAPSVAYLVDAAGETVRVPIDKAQELLELGWGAATPEQVEALKREEKFGEPGQQAIAGLESFGRGVTAGLLTPAEIALGVPAEDIAGRQEANPAQDVVLTGAGVIAPILATGGASALAQGGARGAASLTPAALAAGAGRATAGAVERAVAAALPSAAESVAGRLAARGAAEAAAGVVEGGLFGVGQVVHESALDPGLTAEQAISHIGWSAGLGGAMGGALGVSEVGVPALAKKAKEAIAGAFQKGEGALGALYRSAEDVTGTKADTATLMLEHRLEIDHLGKSIPTFADDVASASPEMADWLIKNGPRLIELERAFPGATRKLARTSPETAELLATEWPKIITDPKARVEIAQRMGSGISDVLDSTEKLFKRLGQELQPAEARTLLAESDGEAIQLAFARKVDELHELSRTMRAEPEMFEPSYAREVELLRDGLVRDAADLADPFKAWQRGKLLRQQLDDLGMYGKSLSELSVSQRRSVMAIRDMRTKVRNMLTNPRVFGIQAARQEAIDGAISLWKKATGKGSAFRKLFLEKRADGSYGVKQTKLNTWLNQMGDARGIERFEAIGEVMSAARRAIDEAESSWLSAPTGDFSRSSLEEIVKRSIDAIEEGKAAATVTQIYNQLDPRMPWGSMPVAPAGQQMAASVAEAAARQLLPGFVTSTIKSAVKTTTSVPKGIALLTALEKIGRIVERRIDDSMRAILSGAKPAKSAAQGAVSMAPRETSERVAKVQMLAQSEQDNEGLASRVRLESAPETSAAMVMAHGRAKAFLQAKIPPLPPKTMLGPDPEPSKQHEWEFNRAYDAVDRPLSILGLAQSGQLLPMDVEAVRTVYPRLYEQMVSSAMDALVSQKGPIPYRQRLMLAILLGRDVDGTLTPDAIRAAQAAHQAPSRQADAQPMPGAVRPSQAGLSKLDAANRAMTKTQATDARMGAGG